MAGVSKATAAKGTPGRAMRAFAARRLGELIGIALALAAVGLALALLTFDAADPSLNRATSGPVRNLLGVSGAFAAELLLQTIGLAAALVCLLLLAWAWRLVSHQGLAPLWLRLTLSPAALVLAATALAGVAAPATWPLGVGLGGIVGMIALGGIGAVLAEAGLRIDAIVVVAVSGALALLALVPSLALSVEEWRSLGRALRRVGGGGARLIGRLGGRQRRFGESAAELRDALGRAASRADRMEPRLDEIPVPRDRPELDDLVAPRKHRAVPGKRARAARQASLALAPGPGRYELPPLDLLQPAPADGGERAIDQTALAQNAQLLESVLDDFGVHGEIVKVRPGPVVTLYELAPAPGTKSSRVIGLADDIARSMSAVSARVAVVPGHNVIGIELPNARRETVYLRELLSSQSFERANGLPLSLGKDISGSPVIADLARMPHLLIAGTTGAGKSVAINTMILSLLYRLSPEQCKLILIDPKMLELSAYDDIPHLISPVVTEPRKAVVALKWTVREMEERYRAMSQLGVRNIASYNARLGEARRRNELLMRKVQTGFDDETGKPVFEEQPLDLKPLPFLVVVVDEMADLMLVSGKEIETAVQRLSQMARAAGIHIIMATQRPSVDVITGTIKANFPTRVSFQVTSKIDSRTILGDQGAEQLLGQGDMLYMMGGGRIVRVHGPFVSDGEVERVVEYLRSQGEPDYMDEITVDEEVEFGSAPGDGPGDELYDQAVALVCRERKASTSFVQRHLQIGYNRAARIIERMESEGVVSPANHVGRREVLTGDMSATA